MSKLDFVVSQFTLAAGASQPIHIPGTFFYFTESNGDVDVVVDRAGGGQGFEAGLGWSTPAGQQFDQLLVRNSGAASVTFTIAIGYGDLRDARAQFASSLKVGAGGDTFSDDGAVSIGTVAVTLLAANADRTRAIVRAGAADLWLGPANTVTAAGEPTVKAGAQIEVLHRGIIWGIRLTPAVNAGALEETE